MHEWPSVWTTTELGTLITRIEAGLNVKCEERPPGHGERGLVKISAVTWGRFDEHQSKTLHPDTVVEERNRIRTGDLLISRANTIELVGASVIVGPIERTLYLSDKVLRLVVDERSKRWVNYALKTPTMRKAIEDSSSGNQLSMRNLSQDRLRALPIPIAPLSEQQRIADKLDTVLARVDACRDRLARVAPLLKRFRQSVLAAATSGRLTEDWRRSASAQLTRETGPDLLEDVQVWKRQWLNSGSQHNEANRIEKRVKAFRRVARTKDGLPDTWTSASLEDAVLMVVDCHNKTAPYEKDGVPLVRTTNVRNGRFVWEDLRFVSEATYRFWSRRCPPEPGDLVFTREAPMGEVAIIPSEVRICLGQRTMLIRPIEAVVPAKFLQICLMDPSFRERSEQGAVGSGVKHYRVGDVSELVVPLPPAIEQTEIVRRVETLFAYADRLEARLAQAQTAVDRLTPSLLAKAFRGELVPQDPADEPAAELLKRLAASRTAPVTKTRKPRQGQAA